jgi:CRP-like cAMP-binding protein
MFTECLLQKAGQSPDSLDVEGFWGDEGQQWPPEGDNALTWLASVRECAAFLRAVPILSELDESALWTLAQLASEASFEPGTVVVGQGDDGPDKQFFIVRSGTATVMRRDTAGLEQPVARLGCGSYFGELGILTNRARNATVRVGTAAPLRAYGFDALTFHRHIAEHVLVFRMMRERRRLQRAGEGARVRLNRLGVLKGMSQADLDFVLRSSEQRHYPSATTLFDQGDDGDRFFVLLDGRVAVERDGDVIARLGPGEFFGETALLFDTPRTATVRTMEPTVTWSITRAAFQRVVGHHLLTNPQTQERVMQRAGALIHRPR